MKKRILLLSAATVVGGLLYALKGNRRSKNGGAKESDELANEPDTNGPETSANGFDAATEDKSDARSNEQKSKAASMAKIEDGQAAIESGADHELDDHGTRQAEALQILTQIRDDAFEASDEKLALALGRPTEEIEQWIGGRELIDGDVLLKARTLATQRGLHLE